MWRSYIMAGFPCRPVRVSCSLLQLQAFASAAEAIAAHNELPKITCHRQELIQRLCEEGCVDRALGVLSDMEFAPSDNVYLSLLKACNKSKALSHVKSVHWHLTRHDANLSSLLGDYLVMTLAKCGAIDEACQIFGTFDRRTVYSWTALISAFVDCDRVHEAFDTYQRMRMDGIEPDSYTFVTLLKACGIIGDDRKGKALHAEVRRRGFASDVFVCNTLVSMYAKCGAVDEAENVFCGMSERNIVSWCSMLCAYVDNGHAEKALHLYRQMQLEGVSPDSRTYVFTLQACNILADKEEAVVTAGQYIKIRSLELGRAIHSDARRKGFMSDIFVCTALLGMYGKCQAIAEAESMLRAVPERNIISWNAMLTAYVELDLGKKALRSYKQVLEECETLDDVTFLCILQACSETGFVEICKHLHFEVVSAGLDSILSMAATLIHAYGSSASMVDAQVIFDELSEPHIASWNASIAGNAGEGNPIKSLRMFETMKSSGMKPDEVTFLLVISACSHNGLVAQALEYFDSMTSDYGLTPDLRHYGIMVNLLGRAGDFRHIKGILGRMPMQANLTIWLCLLGACRLHGNLVVAKEAFKQAVRLQPKHATSYVLMSNIYGDAGLQKCADEVEQLRKERCGEEVDQELDEG
eukprot:c14276_g1_i1 orf=495-2414(+)